MRRYWFPPVSSQGLAKIFVLTDPAFLTDWWGRRPRVAVELQCFTSTEVQKRLIKEIQYNVDKETMYSNAVLYVL